MRDEGYLVSAIKTSTVGLFEVFEADAFFGSGSVLSIAASNSGVGLSTFFLPTPSPAEAMLSKLMPMEDNNPATSWSRRMSMVQIEFSVSSCCDFSLTICF